MSADRPAASNSRPGVARTRHLGASWQSHPPIAFYVCVLTGTLETRLLPTILHVHPRRHRLIVQWHLTWVGGNSLARHPGPIDHCASPVAPVPSRFATFWACHRPLCRSINGLSASAGNSVRDRPAMVPLRAPAGDPTPITPVKGIYLKR